jgi:hypothetical protein
VLAVRIRPARARPDPRPSGVGAGTLTNNGEPSLGPQLGRVVDGELCDEDAIVGESSEDSPRQGGGIRSGIDGPSVLPFAASDEGQEPSRCLLAGRILEWGTVRIRAGSKVVAAPGNAHRFTGSDER